MLLDYRNTYQSMPFYISLPRALSSSIFMTERAISICRDQPVLTSKLAIELHAFFHLHLHRTCESVSWPFTS